MRKLLAKRARPGEAALRLHLPHTACMAPQASTHGRAHMRACGRAGALTVAVRTCGEGCVCEVLLRATHNGSNLTELKPHCGQSTVLLYKPWAAGRTAAARGWAGTTSGKARAYGASNGSSNRGTDRGMACPPACLPASTAGGRQGPPAICPRLAACHDTTR